MTTVEAQVLSPQEKDIRAQEKELWARGLDFFGQAKIMEVLGDVVKRLKLTEVYLEDGKEGLRYDPKTSSLNSLPQNVNRESGRAVIAISWGHRKIAQGGFDPLEEHNLIKIGVSAYTGTLHIEHGDPSKNLRREEEAADYGSWVTDLGVLKRALMEGFKNPLVVSPHFA